MQRILSRGEIETLDHNQFPLTIIPNIDTLFSYRASRFQKLVQDNIFSDYLSLMIKLSEAQHIVLNQLNRQKIGIIPDNHYSVPPCEISIWNRHFYWINIQNSILNIIMYESANIPNLVIDTCKNLKRLIQNDLKKFNDIADSLLIQGNGNINKDFAAAAPLIMAALQVYWVSLLSNFKPNQLPISRSILCPFCGSLPIGSVIRIGGNMDNHRYLSCSLCSTEWHLVRVKCSNCESTKSINYSFIEKKSEWIKAESCNQCYTYRKIFLQEKDPYVDPIADDLSSISLDILMNDDGYTRSSNNPFLYI
ncbi:MAG: formate dehydrogenase accessory protein FdhE [Bordetella sp.]|nr:MAG: formate dehydrogenase accessory protein FdhE [Bordetella sp.]